MADILVRPLASHPTRGLLSVRSLVFRCALGRNGVRNRKQEGDGATPTGCYPLRRVLYRPDVFDSCPPTRLPIHPIGERDGWCDDPSDAAYNTAVSRPYTGRHECLWRNDHLYDLVVVLGYNDRPPIPGRGSALFMHIARPGYAPTEGCVALHQNDLQKILEVVHPDDTLVISAQTATLDV